LLAENLDVEKTQWPYFIHVVDSNI